ncbi:MAG TPA: zinc-dependent metalloprotease, partial [Acidimicrobiales bacterium]|nr:zinc-dependent metalloprotease [Acidimicrobiales bacterium]
MSNLVDWELAERIATRLARRNDPFSDSYHYASLEPDFAELTSQAEDLVAACTGLRSQAGPARAR